MTAIDCPSQLDIDRLVELVFIAFVPNIESAFSANVTTNVYVACCLLNFVYLMELHRVTNFHLLRAICYFINTCFFLSEFLSIASQSEFHMAFVQQRNKFCFKVVQIVIHFRSVFFYQIERFLHFVILTLLTTYY